MVSAKALRQGYVSIWETDKATVAIIDQFCIAGMKKGNWGKLENRRPMGHGKDFGFYTGVLHFSQERSPQHCNPFYHRVCHHLPSQTLH